MTIDAYDAEYFEGNSQAANRPALRWYAELISKYGSGSPFLDVGCGTGWLLRRLSMKGRAIGYDASSYAVTKAQEVAPKAKVVTSLTDIEDDSISSVAMIHLVEHLTDFEFDNLMSQVNRITASNASILVATPDVGGTAAHIHQDKWIAYGDPTHINLGSSEYWRSRFGEFGWTLRRQGSDGMWNGPYRTRSKLEKWWRLLLPAISVISGRLIVPVGKGESFVGIFSRQV